MSLAERILADNHRIFMNMEHFGETHIWNGYEITCVVDEDEALKRKNNSVVDLSWDSNTRELVIYTPVDVFPERLQPNTHIIFDGEPRRVLQFHAAKGMYTIMLGTYETRTMQP